MLQGSLDQTVLTSVIHDLHVDQKSGLLLVSAEEISKRVYFREGSIIFANSDLNEDRLGEFLIRTGKIKRPEFDLAIQLMKDLQLRLGGTLVQMGHLSREEMQQGVTEQIKAIISSLFAWSSGAYAFDDQAPKADEDILVDLSTADIILEGTRRLMDSEMILSSLGELGAVLCYTKDSLQVSQKLKLTSQEAFLLSRVDGSSTISEMVSLSPLEEDETLRCMYGLILAGVLEKKSREIPLKPTGGPATRQVMAAGRSAGAVIAEPLTKTSGNPSSAPAVSSSNAKKAEVYFEQGRCYISANCYSEAVQSLRDAARLDPSKKEYQRLLTLSMAKVPEMRKQAKAQFEYAIQKDPSDAEAYLGLAELYEVGGQPAWAQRMYRKVLSLEPENKLARAKLQGKRIGAAIGDLLLRGKKR